MIKGTNDALTLVNNFKKDDFHTEYIIPELLTKRGSLTIFGPSKGGKTFFAMQLGLSLAYGINFLEFKIEKKYKVLYINGELEEEDFAERIFDFNKLNNISDDEKFDFKFEFVDDEDSDDINDDFDEYVENLIAKYENQEIDVIIIDPIYSFIDEENNSKDFKDFLKSVKKLRKKLKCSVILIHHRGKKTDDYDLPNRGAGSSVVGRRVKSIIDLARKKEGKKESDSEFVMEYTGTRVKKQGKIYLKRIPDYGFFKVYQSWRNALKHK